jgi:hypothetical protein
VPMYFRVQWSGMHDWRCCSQPSIGILFGQKKFGASRSGSPLRPSGAPAASAVSCCGSTGWKSIGTVPVLSVSAQLACWFENSKVANQPFSEQIETNEMTAVLQVVIVSSVQPVWQIVVTSFSGPMRICVSVSQGELLWVWTCFVIVPQISNWIRSGYCVPILARSAAN